MTAATSIRNQNRSSGVRAIPFTPGASGCAEPEGKADKCGQNLVSLSDRRLGGLLEGSDKLLSALDAVRAGPEFSNCRKNRRQILGNVSFRMRVAVHIDL